MLPSTSQSNLKVLPSTSQSNLMVLPSTSQSNLASTSIDLSSAITSADVDSNSLAVEDLSEPSQVFEDEITTSKDSANNIPHTTAIKDDATPNNNNVASNPPEIKICSQNGPNVLSSQNSSWFRLVGYHAVILFIVLLTMNYVYYNLDNNLIIMSFAIFNSFITTQPFIILLLSHKFRIYAKRKIFG